MEIAPHPILMYSNRVLALITARGGSKGLPRKNVLLAGGKPLIAWTVEAALSAASVTRVVLSTDDDEIMAAASAFGCDVPFRRPAELASDQATSIDVVLHALRELPEFDFVMLLQPTSPLRTSSDIDAAFKTMLANDAPACVSVVEVEQSPYLMYNLNYGGRLRSLFEPWPSANRRQDLPPVYALNGAIYIAKIEWLLQKKSFLSLETIAYKMPKERSLDIDDEIDFQILLQKLKKSG
jgi:N-acylneuraminate cytidylyltransferase